MCREKLCGIVLALALVLTAGARADITTGLVGYWPLDGDAVDASGNGANGTINGTVVPAPDREGSPNAAMRFDGVTGTNINVGNPSHLQITGAMTLAAWVSLDATRQTSTIANNGRILSKAGASGNRCWSLNIENDLNGLRYPAAFQVARNGTTIISVNDTQSLPTDEWVHMAGVYRPAQAIEVYVNGELRADSTTDVPDTQFSSSLAVMIGNRPAGGSNAGWPGMIDEARIYARALSPADLRELVFGRPGLASGPKPADEATDVPVDTSLSWTTGEFAATHDVYFGAGAADVDAASAANPLNVLVSRGQSGTTFDPGRLAFDSTYFWRIDEVNGTPDHTVYEGNVWSFRTEPLAYRITDILATASSSTSADTGPGKTVDGSGLVNGLHDATLENMWQSAPTEGLPATIAFEFDRPYKLHEMKIWNHNTLQESSWASAPRT